MIKKVEYLNPIDLSQLVSFGQLKEAEKEAQRFLVFANLDKIKRLAYPVDSTETLKAIFFKVLSKHGVNWAKVETVPLLATHVDLMDKYNHKHFTKVISGGYVYEFVKDDSSYCWIRESEAELKNLNDYPVVVDSTFYTFNCRTRL